MSENLQSIENIQSHKKNKPDLREQERIENQNISARMTKIKHKVLVLSGKGGVGKSTIAVNLAVSLAESGYKVGLLDIDIHGPSIPQMLKLNERGLKTEGDAIIPARFSENLKAISMGLLMEGRDEAVIWRGPLKMKMIKQFLMDVDWGELDYLIVDSPPGTGDEPLSIAQLLPDADGAVIVTTPQEISLVDVRKCVNFCRKLSLRILGVVENMSGFICPTCSTRIEIFNAGGGLKMAEEMKVPFLTSIPIDKKLVESCDNGKPFMKYYSETGTAKAFQVIVDKITEAKPENATRYNQQHEAINRDNNLIRIAIPVSDGKLCTHFGHCETFSFVEVDEGSKQIKYNTQISAPLHQPGLLPRWLHEHGVNLVITGGIGERAKDLLLDQGIGVILGAPPDPPEHLVQWWLEGSLISGDSSCDHSGNLCGHGDHICNH